MAFMVLSCIVKAILRETEWSSGRREKLHPSILPNENDENLASSLCGDKKTPRIYLGLLCHFYYFKNKYFLVFL